MALFSKLRSAPAPVNSAETAARGILSIALLSAAADGQIDEAEMLQIMSMCAFSPIFNAIGHTRTHEIAAEVLKDLRSPGANTLFESARAMLSQPLRETALCFAIRAALADGYLDPNEKNTLAAMGERLGVSLEDFIQMFQYSGQAPAPCDGVTMSEERYSEKRLKDDFSVYLLFSEPLTVMPGEIREAVKEDYPSLDWSDVDEFPAPLEIGRVGLGIWRRTAAVGEPAHTHFISTPGRMEIDWEEILENSKKVFPNARDVVN